MKEEKAIIIASVAVFLAAQELFWLGFDIVHRDVQAMSRHVVTIAVAVIPVSVVPIMLAIFWTTEKLREKPSGSRD